MVLSSINALLLSSGEISLVCLGPLTNLALALRLDPLIATNLRELIIVGGNVEGWLFPSLHTILIPFGEI